MNNYSHLRKTHLANSKKNDKIITRHRLQEITRIKEYIEYYADTHQISLANIDIEELLYSLQAIDYLTLEIYELIIAIANTVQHDGK